MNENMILGEGYSFKLVNIDCMRESTHFNVIMELDEPVEDLLPYLAALLPGCTYTHGSGVVNLMNSGHIVGIYARRITITDVTGIEEARDLCAKYFADIRDAEANRSSITPVLKKQPTISVLDILRALPGTNCGLCGSTTCMAFAAGVFRREAQIGACRPLQDEPKAFEALLERLREEGGS